MSRRRRPPFKWLNDKPDVDHGYDPEYSSFDEDDDDEEGEVDGIPFGCRACGGDYPNCTTSCPLFDD